MFFLFFFVLFCFLDIKQRKYEISIWSFTSIIYYIIYYFLLNDQIFIIFAKDMYFKWCCHNLISMEARQKFLADSRW